jgi:hypothetical protein
VASEERREKNYTENTESAEDTEKRKWAERKNKRTKRRDTEGAEKTGRVARKWRWSGIAGGYGLPLVHGSTDGNGELLVRGSVDGKAVAALPHSKKTRVWCALGGGAYGSHHWGRDSKLRWRRMVWTAGRWRKCLANCSAK